MTRPKTSPALLKRTVLAALNSIGIAQSAVKFYGSKITIPEFEIVAEPALENGNNVWAVSQKFSMMKMEDAFETEVVTQLFSVPLYDDIGLARNLALQLAAMRVNAAIDEAVS